MTKYLATALSLIFVSFVTCASRANANIAASTRADSFVQCAALASSNLNAVPTDPEFGRVLSSLADLKVRVEVLRASGVQAESALLLKALAYEYKQKFDEVLADSIKFKLVSSSEEFLVRLRFEVAKRYANQTDIDRESRRRHEAESSVRRNEEEAMLFVNFAAQGKFYVVKPGEFTLKPLTYGIAETKIVVAEPFSMMDIDVTQAMWVWINQLLGERDSTKLNPSFFGRSDDNPLGVEIVRIAGMDIELSPDYPVDSITSESADRFVEGLNRLSISGDESIQKAIRAVFPDHTKGAFYQIPTLDQLIFVQANRGVNSRGFFDTEMPDNLEHYSWLMSESRFPKPVRTKLPRVIDTGYGQQANLFDLVGNVWKLTRSYVGVGPDSPVLGSRAITGGPDDRYIRQVQLGSSFPESLVETYLRRTGLRLIRYAPHQRPEIERQILVEKQKRSLEEKELHDAQTILHPFQPIVGNAKKLEFSEIKPDEFTLIIDENPLPRFKPDEFDVKLTLKFALATDLVSQTLWSKVQVALGEVDPLMINPSRFKMGRRSLLADAGGVQFHLRPDAPVEMVNPQTVMTWLKGLNGLSNNRDPRIQSLLKELIPEHERGDEYDLPTISQLGFVVQNRGKNPIVSPADAKNPLMLDDGYGRVIPFHGFDGDMQVMMKDTARVNPLPFQPRLDMDRSEDSGGRKLTSFVLVLADGSKRSINYLGYSDIGETPSSSVGIRLVRYRSTRDKPL